jgi:hypothetical protein
MDKRGLGVIGSKPYIIGDGGSDTLAIGTVSSHIHYNKYILTTNQRSRKQRKLECATNDQDLQVNDNMDAMNANV